MKPRRLAVLAALALAALTTGGAPVSAETTSCRPADVVFYTTDTVRLATELSKFGSQCAEYYLSVTPTSTGDPRGGPPITTIRGLGPRFHAMAEIRLNVWSAYAATSSWYEAGVEVRRRMALAGYDVSRGDTWAINEVGAPSSTPMGVDVLLGVGTARADLREFVRGLHDGPNGTPSTGLVFVAEPPQVTTELAQYKEQLQAWLADSPFWQDMSASVRFWAQETYADARAWGVADADPAERAARLGEYFQHALRLADAGPGSASAARAFLANAYAPVGNASYPWGPPELNPNSIGFGFTNVPPAQMEHFISGQTYALRAAGAGSRDRFGFAWVPNTRATPPVPATTFVALADRLAASIQGSETHPAGACGTDFALCSAAIDGAQFNDAWSAFAAWSPPTNTPEGTAVRVEVLPGVAVTFDSIVSRGSTQGTASATGFPPPLGLQLRPGTSFYELWTTAAYTGSIEVCVDYEPAAFAGFVARLFRLGAAGWSEITRTTHEDAVCGASDGLGSFAVFAGDPTPPVIAAQVEGSEGSNGWYVGDVTVSWNVSDPQSPLDAEGCDPTTIDADTPGTTLTCTATSHGGTTSSSVTIRRDATPPTMACLPTPAVLWPPNGKLVPVAVDVDLRDETSGPDGFVLDAVSATGGEVGTDVVDFEVGQADVAGRLRAERAGRESSRTYRLEYTGHDAAGNAARCTAGVLVPHDHGRQP